MPTSKIVATVAATPTTNIPILVAWANSKTSRIQSETTIRTNTTQKTYMLRLLRSPLSRRRATTWTTSHMKQTATQTHLTICQAPSIELHLSLEPMTRIELVTSPLPRECSTN